MYLSDVLYKVWFLHVFSARTSIRTYEKKASQSQPLNTRVNEILVRFRFVLYVISLSILCSLSNPALLIRFFSATFLANFPKRQLNKFP